MLDGGEAWYRLPDGDWGPARRRDEAAWQAALRRAHAARGEARCLCGGAGDLRLYVVRRGGRYGLARWPGGGPAHGLACPHHAPDPSLGGLGGYARGVVGERGDGTRLVRLRLGLGLGPRAAGGPGPGAERPAPGGPRGAAAPRPAMTELGLLHLLWEGAGLNRWHPSWAGRRGWGVAGRALWAAAEGVVVGRVALAGRLVLVVPGCGPDWTAGFAARNRALAGDEVGRGRLVVVGEVRDLLVSPSGLGIALRAAGAYGVRVRASGDWLARLRERHPRAVAAVGEAGVRVVALAVGEGSRGRDGTVWVRAEAAALMLATEAFIPVEGGHERDVAERLVAEGREFVKPLRYDAGDGLHPDFLLYDTDPRPWPLEVYGMADREDYRERMAARRALHAGRFGHGAWEWVAAPGSAPPPFPRAAARA